MITAGERATPATPPKPAMLIGGIAIAIAAVSASAIFIRLADAPALAIAFWRNAIAVAVLGPSMLIWRAPMPRGRTLGICLASGLMLAGHFALWITSLDYTSVAAAVVLVCTQPIFVAILAHIFLREVTTWVAWIGIVVAVAGTTLIGSDFSIGTDAAFGNLLALGGAITVALYVLLGRVARSDNDLALLPYAVVVYSTSAVAIFVLAWLSQTSLTGFSSSTWGWIAAVAIGPQVIGHTLFNWALRWVKASLLSSVILIEPVVSTALAYAVLSETPGSLTVLGGLIVLSGVAIVIRGR